MRTQDQQYPELLVTLAGDEPTTTSRKVASAFGKRHGDVIRAIKALDCSENFTERNFALSDYQDTKGRHLPMYNITKNGFMFLVMGFRGHKANAIKERYINAFDLMSGELNDADRYAQSAVERYLAHQIRISKAGRDMRYWQDKQPILLKQIRLEEAGQQNLGL